MESQTASDDTRRPEPSYANPDPRAIAIIGLSISSPGGADQGLDTEAFYAFLKARGSGIITVPNNRWNAQAYHGTAPGKICTTKGGFIPKFSYGDLQEFGITPAEGAQVAVAQTVLLHQAFNALQRSGIDYRGSRTGVYVGSAGGAPSFEMDITQAGPYYMTGTSLAINANRINYVFDLLGPSLPVDTACSSSLTAMHLAIQALRNGECDQAVVAGVNFIENPLETSSFSQLGVLSPDGISKSFDDAADGYARGDVASAVVIKRHDLAVRDCDRIHATLVGTALTSCGSIMGSLTTPSPQAQTLAICTAFRDAGLSPHQVDFVELHGTGTVVGDAFEANAAGEAFSEGRGGREIVVGSVKSNIGHGEMGAYMSSLIKVTMMLERKQILPNGYFKKPSSRIHFDKFKLRVPVQVEEMAAHDSKLGLIASISSFGFGGSCGHTVLREHEARPVQPDNAPLQNGPFLFAIGGLSPKACKTLIQRYKDQCININQLALSAHLCSRARQLPWRTYTVTDSLKESIFPDPSLIEKRPNPLVFCFSGQGPQHWQQGRQLFAAYSAFRESIYACDRLHEEYTGHSFLQKTGLFIQETVKTSLAECHNWPADVISVAISLFQIALFDLLTAICIKPDAIVGHSIGETAVLYASGAVTRDMAVKIAVARGRALALVDGCGGAMVAVSGCDESSICDYIEAARVLSHSNRGEARQLYVAAYNSPTDIGVSGDEKLVDVLANYIENWVDGVTAQKLRVSTAVHSPFVDPCEEQYRTELAGIFAYHPGPHIPTIVTMSTVTAEFKADAYSIDYLWRNLRQPVLFSSAIQKIIEKFGERTTFMEISPHSVLSQYINQMGAFDAIAGSMRPPSTRHLKPDITPPTEVHTLLHAIGRLLLCGINSVNFSILTGCPPSTFEGPTYPFQMTYCSMGSREPTYLRKLLPSTRPLNSTRLRVSPNLPEPWISHHVIDHSNLIPASAYIEMALEFPGVTHVWDCRFENVYMLDESVPPGVLEISKEGNRWWVKSSSALQSMQGDLEWTRSGAVFDTLHSYGRLGYGRPVLGPNDITHVDIDVVLTRCTQTYEKAALYADLEGIAQFGPEFQRVNRASVNETEAICWIRGHVDGMNCTDYTFHPAIMDAVFQSCISWNLLYEKVNVGGKDRSFLLPHSLCRAFRNDGDTTPLVLPEEFMTYAVLASWSAHHWTMDVYVLAEDGTVVFTFQGLHFALVNQGHEWPTERYMMYWQPHGLPVTRNGGLVKLEESEYSNATALLQVLDQLALTNIRNALNIIPLDYEPVLYDRKKYLAWAKNLVSKVGYDLLSLHDIPGPMLEKYASLFELTQRVGESQKDIMVDSMASVEGLFHDDLMGRIYEHPPFIGSVFDATAEQFIRLIKEASDAGKRVIRVLEVGAGTGRLTALLGQALIEANVKENCYVDYVSTDVSISLAQEAMKRSPWPIMTAVAFDLSIPIEHQKLDTSSFDIIVGFDVLHAIPSIQNTLTTLRNLLLPGGHLVIVELDGHSFATDSTGTIWMNHVFGSFREWMGVLEHRIGSTHCTLTQAQWKESLETVGFSDLLFLVSAAVTTVAHMAFVCQRDPLSVKPNPVTPMPPLGRFDASTDSSCSSSGPVTPPDDDTTSLIHLSPGPTELTAVLMEKRGVEGIHLPIDGFSPSQSPRLTINSSFMDTTTVYRFVAGGEVELVALISGLDVTKPLIFWLYTDTGCDNGRLIGLTRTIRHEFSQWKFYMVLFHPSWTPTQQEEYIFKRLMPLHWIDAEILIDEQGNIAVPRVVIAPSPPRMEPRGSSAIQFNGTDIWRAYPPELGPDDVEVRVAFVGLSPVFSDCSEFAGCISAVGPEVGEGLTGEHVFGVVASTPGSVIVCRRSKVSRVPSCMDMASAAAVVGRLLLVASIVRKAIHSSSSKSPRVLLHAGKCSPAAVATYSFLKSQSLDVLVTIDDRSSSQVPSNMSIFSAAFIAKEYDVWSFSVQKWATKGVDVAFDFSEDIDVSEETIRLLSKTGIFVQIGGDRGCRIHHGQQFISVDYRSIAEDDSILSEVVDTLGPTLIAALTPSTELYEASDLSSAQARAPSISTDVAVLLNLQDIDPKLPVLKGGLIRGTAAFNPRAAYVIIGGIGGLGACIARFLVENGARHIILTSRSGEKAFTSGRLIREKKTISYLREIPGVTVNLAAVDCLDALNTKMLFLHSPYPVAGVFYVPVRLNDQLFTNLTAEEDWKTVYDVKVEGLKVLLGAVDPNSLDFLVLASSMATVSGSPGQANYAAAQTEMEAIGATLPNTVSIAVPPITDGGVFVRSMPSGNARNAALDKYKALGMSGMQVAEYCLDAIWTINTNSSNALYIPPMNWKKVSEIGVPEYHLSCMRHLLVNEVLDAGNADGFMEQTIRAACANALSLKVEDVEDTIPLSSYGLDSLTSVRLSGVLKTHFDITVTQLQLLSSHMTVEKLQAMQEAQKLATTSDHNNSTTSPTEDAELNPSHEPDAGETIIRLNTRVGDRILFLLHGAGGGVRVMTKLASKLKCVVFGVQDTPEAPLTGTLDDLSRFYLEKIKEKQPGGPYLLSGFSFGTCLAVNIAHMLQNSGETVDLLVMLDGAPTLFHRPTFRDYTRRRITEGTLREDIMDVISDMSQSGALDDAEEVTGQFADHFRRISQGGSGPKWVVRFCKAYVAHILMGVRVSTEVFPKQVAGEPGPVWPAKRTVLVRADRGVSVQPYADGASRFFDLEKWAPDAELYEVSGTHFGILNPDSGLAEVLNGLLKSESSV